MDELRNLASRTIFNELPLAKILTRFVNGWFPFGVSSLFTGEMFLFVLEYLVTY